MEESRLRVRVSGPFSLSWRRLALLLDRRVTQNRIIDRHPSQIIVLLVVCIDERSRKVWYVKTTVALSCQVDFVVVDLKSIDEALVEAKKFLAELDLVRDVRDSLRISDANRLLDPNHIGQIDPCVWILSGG